MFNKEFNNIIFNKNLIFRIKKQSICKNIKINYFLKKNAYSSFKKLRHKELFFIIIKFENFFGLVPLVKKINVKIKSKKKKVFSVSYIYMCLTISRKFKSFFDLFFIKNSFLLLFEILSKNKFYDYSQELNFKKLCVNYLVNYNSVSFNFNFSSAFLNERVLEILEDYKRSNILRFDFRFVFFGPNSKYILNFLNLFIINYKKFTIFFYKYFKNKNIKI